jgi:pimeloyl-ACP methyl ester carboxylesterase
VNQGCDNRPFLARSPGIVPSLVLSRALSVAALLIFCFAPTLAVAQLQSTHAVIANDPAAVSPAIVIGFVGGFVKHDNPVHAEVQLATRLRKQYPTGVDVETFESYHGTQALRKVLQLLDADHSGSLTTQEKKNARIIIYGHSWGGSQSLVLARALRKDGIPVLLTVQVDSVSKPGVNGTLVPPNVLQAANFYQVHGIVHGHAIRAADPARTRIIGNFRVDYKADPLNCPEYPWYDRLFVKPHTQIECDPEIWNRVDSLIGLNLPSLPPWPVAEAHSP